MIIAGYIEQISERQAQGWAYCAAEPARRLSVRAALDERVIGSSIANTPRPDLAAHAMGDGNHGFTIMFDMPVNAEDIVQIEITAFIDGGDQAKTKLSRVVAPPPPPPPQRNIEDAHAALATAEADLLNPQPAAAAEPEATLPPTAPPSPLTHPPLPIQDLDQHPVFILGAARSGTSAMAQGLLRSGAYEGFEEGHFLWLIERFLLTIDDFYAFNGEDGMPDRFTLLSRVPAGFMIDAVRGIFVNAMGQFYPQGRWVDKTPRPEMIEAAPLMQELFPNARFVFMKRRGLENVSSRLRKFPSISFVKHCEDWARSMQTWLAVRDILGGAALEVEQLAIAREPDRSAREVGDFLALPPDAVHRLAIAFANDRPERTTTTFVPVMQIDRIGWSTAQITQFRRICGPMMAACGYSYAQTYFAIPMREVTTDQIIG